MIKECAGERGRADKRWIDLLPIERPVDDEPGEDRIGDADRGNFGRGGDAVHNRDADQRRQQQGWQRNHERATDFPHRHDAAIDLCALRHPPAGDDRERQREHHAGKDTAGEQSGDRYACHQANDDERDGRGYRLGHRA